MNRTRAAVGGALLATTLMAQPAFAGGASHVEFSIAGEVFPCPKATYNVQSGSIKEVFQSVESKSGNQMFTVTDVPSHVVLTDERGTSYSMRGAI